MITQSINDLPFLAIGDEWARRVVANGGAAPSGNTLRAVASFRASVKSILSQIVLCNIFAPDSYYAAMTPLIQGPSAAIWPIATPGYPAQSVNGWTMGSVLDPRINAVFTPSTSGLSFNNLGIVLYGYDLTDSNGGKDFGASHVATGDGLFFYNSGGNHAAQIGKVPLTVAGAATNGFYSIQRTSSTNLNMYFANSTNAHASVASDSTLETGDISTLNFPTSMGLNVDGTVGFCSNRIYSFLAITTGMNATDSATLYAAVQQLRVNIGGGFR